MKKTLKFTGILVLSLLLVLGFTWTVSANVQGAIFTTNIEGVINENHFNSKDEVYLNGGPSNNRLTKGDYYVQVTDPGGGVLGKSSGKAVRVGDDGKFVKLYQLIDIVNTTSSNYQVKGFDTTSNEGNGYKVWISLNENFSQDESKTDNFKIIGEGSEHPIVGRLTVKYVDIDGKTLAASKLRTDLELTTYMEEAIDIEGYVLRGTSPIGVTLTEDDPEQEIVFVYEKVIEIEVLGSLLVKYVDIDGKTLAASKMRTDLELTTYMEEAIDIEGYVLRGTSPISVTLTMDKPDQEIMFTYEKEMEPEKTEKSQKTEETENTEVTVIIEEEEIPLGRAKLPQTSGTPASLFYGVGFAITLLGSILKKKL
ncbi:MAG: MucBP domain-containing protein [Alkaliphilus sp.]